MSYLPSALGYGRAHTVPLALTDEVPPTQIAVPAEERDYFVVTLGGANHEFAFPTGLVAGERRILLLEVEHGGNDYDITAAGYDWGADGAPGTGPQGTRDFLTLIWNGATLSGSLVAYYRFNNDLLDLTSNANHLTGFNGPGFSVDVPFP